MNFIALNTKLIRVLLQCVSYHLEQKRIAWFVPKFCSILDCNGTFNDYRSIVSTHVWRRHWVNECNSISSGSGCCIFLRKLLKWEYKMRFASAMLNSLAYLLLTSFLLLKLYLCDDSTKFASLSNLSNSMTLE